MSCTSCSDPVASPSQTTTYYVTLLDSNGCSATLAVTVVVKCGEVFVPTAFSPNGDGENELLYVRGYCINNLLFKIYDRWGNKVWETTDFTNGWDGAYKEKAMDAAVFVYFLDATLNNGEQVVRKGNISLVR